MVNVPRCLSTVRFHQALNEGVLKEHEVRALETNRRLSGTYRGLRSCDGRFNAMVERGRAEGEGADPASLPAPELLYAEYITCASEALCEQALTKWSTCLESVQREKTDIRQCAQLKTLLERCMRSKTEDLVKASQPQVFRPSAVP